MRAEARFRACLRRRPYAQQVTSAPHLTEGVTPADAANA